jgi:hypothetical protein
MPIRLPAYGFTPDGTEHAPLSTRDSTPETFTLRTQGEMPQQQRQGCPPQKSETEVLPETNSHMFNGVELTHICKEIS